MILFQHLGVSSILVQLPLCWYLLQAHSKLDLLPHGSTFLSFLTAGETSDWLCSPSFLKTWHQWEPQGFISIFSLLSFCSMWFTTLYVVFRLSSALLLHQKLVWLNSVEEHWKASLDSFAYPWEMFFFIIEHIDGRAGWPQLTSNYVNEFVPLFVEQNNWTAFQAFHLASLCRLCRRAELPKLSFCRQLLRFVSERRPENEQSRS